MALNPHTLRNKEIRLLSETLPEGNLIVSLDNTEEYTQAGHFFMADPYDAARGIVSKTHRLATAEEAKKYEGDQAKRREGIVHVENARKANMNIVVTVPAAVAPVPEPVQPAEPKKGGRWPKAEVTE